jgi:mevalonate kinase
MTFKFPAKTFLLGEYVALQGGPAIILTTAPCFEVGVTTTKHAKQIHPESPAGRFWTYSGIPGDLTWVDPYNRIGGLGASSAQFLGAYAAYLSHHQVAFTEESLLEAYWDASFTNTGIRPSGYDVLAQAQSGCVYLHRNQSDNRVYDWPFADLAFVLLHTGKKLATHHHLQTFAMTDLMRTLSPIVALGKQAFEENKSALLIQAVNAYHEQLMVLDLVAEQTQAHITHLSENPDVLAIKGCGALGADVLLVLVSSSRLNAAINTFSAKGFPVLASSRNLYLEEKSHGMHFTS